jgi:hypothetical protein
LHDDELTTRHNSLQCKCQLPKMSRDHQPASCYSPSLATSHEPGKPTRTVCWFNTCSPNLCTSYLRSIFQQPPSTQQSFRNQTLYLLQSIPSCSSAPSSFVHNNNRTQTHKQDARHIVCGITTASMGFRSRITAHLIHFPR